MDYVKQWIANEKVRSADLNFIQKQAASVHQVAWSWRGRRPTLASDGADVTVGAHNGVAAGTGQDLAVMIPGAGITDLTLPTLSSNTWYYIYVRNSGTYDAPTLAYVVSTQVPDATLSHADAAIGGDNGTELPYVGCFRTNSGADPIPFIMRNGRYHYRYFPSDLVVLTAGTTGPGYDTVDLSALVPPHSQLATLLAAVTAPDLVTPARVRPDGTGGTGLLGLPLYEAHQTITTETDVSQEIEYTRGAATNVTLYVLGFEE